MESRIGNRGKQKLNSLFNISHSTFHIRYAVFKRGFILPTVVIFGAIFLVLGLGLTSYLLELQKAEHNRVNDEEAFNIAEAGLNYYAWHLAHFPSDYQDGTGAAGPYVHQYQDPEGGTAGTFSLTISSSTNCGDSNGVDITSVGSTVADPTRSVSVYGRYAHQTVADYSYVLNSSVWAGPSRTILGRYHSNGGIRMDANNQSTVESSVKTWTCTASFGCSGSQTEPGVFGGGSNPSLWTYPVPSIDFAGITVDLATVKAAAKSQGLYFAPLANPQNQRGYHIIFNGDGTITVNTVSATTQVWGSPDGATWQKENNIIHTEKTLGTYTIPKACPVIFVEDRVWLEGTVSGKVTIAAADLTGDGYNPDIILANNINYATSDGTSGLTAIAAGNILIPLNSPDNMTLHGIFVAQNGYYGRNYYCYGSGCSRSVSSTYSGDVKRSTLTTVGSIVSNGRTGTSWFCGSTFCSGYDTRNDSYDGTLAADPPPFTPFTSTTYHFVIWREE